MSVLKRGLPFSWSAMQDLFEFLASALESIVEEDRFENNKKQVT